MRVLIEPDTGELVEVIEELIHDFTPYDYRSAKAAVMNASRERRVAEGEYKKAVHEKGDAERAYRSALSKAILTSKDEHGATVAEAHAKGLEPVAEAKRRLTIGEGMVIAAYQRLLLCEQDRTSLSQLIAWSRAVDSSAYPP